MRITRRLIAAIAAAPLVIGLAGLPMSPADAVTHTATANYLRVTTPSCYDFEAPYCGPQLYVHLADGPITIDEDPSYSATLRSSSGRGVDIGGGYTPTVASNGNLTWRARTGSMPAGTYTFRYSWTVRGYWSCSIYDEDGCTWFADDEGSGSYTFKWTGTSVTAWPLNKPFAPKSVLTKGTKRTVTVKWKAPTYKGAGNKTTKYVVKLGKKKAKKVGKNRRSFTWRKLPRHRNYTVRVWALNKQGAGSKAVSYTYTR